jgi:hypothetical protein
MASFNVALTGLMGFVWYNTCRLHDLIIVTTARFRQSMPYIEEPFLLIQLQCQ